VLEVVFLSRSFRRLRLDSKLVLIGTLGLLAVGIGVFLASEWTRPATIGEQSVGAKVTDSFFHAATARTAGFSTTDYNEIGAANQVSTEALMFIGGASASTAGGIKVGTFMVVVLAAIAIVRGRQHVNAFDREIPSVIIQRAMVVGAMVTGLLIIFFAALMAIQPDLEFRRALFEMVSAFGTVGLSTGITGDLNSGARVLITIAMFIGRFGPLTLALLMAGHETVEPYRFAEERVRIG
jgi:trk system potassium uptake protein TrkH